MLLIGRLTFFFNVVSRISVYRFSVNTNDGFVGIDSATMSTSGPSTIYASAYDAGMNAPAGHYLTTDLAALVPRERRHSINAVDLVKRLRM